MLQIARFDCDCDLWFESRIANHQRFETVWTLSEKLIVLTCCIRNWHCDSNSDLNRGSNHKSRDLKVRFELPETAIWGKSLRCGLRDFIPASDRGTLWSTSARAGGLKEASMRLSSHGRALWGLRKVRVKRVNTAMQCSNGLRDFKSLAICDLCGALSILVWVSFCTPNFCGKRVLKTLLLWPPPVSQRSENRPWVKKSKRSLWGGLRESLVHA